MVKYIYTVTGKTLRLMRGLRAQHCLFCGKLDNTTNRFAPDCVYCQYCGQCSCYYHIRDNEPERFENNNIDTTTIPDDLKLSWTCINCRGPHHNIFEVKYLCSNMHQL